MTDLAPFVAAALRDKVVVDLDEEIQELRELCERYQQVQIVGLHHASMVCAEGYLKEADGLKTSENKHFLGIPLLQRAPFPLGALGKLQILVGGYHRDYMGSLSIGRKRFAVNAWDRLESKESADMSKNVFVWNKSGTVATMFTVHGWPRHHWSRWIGRTPRRGLVKDLVSRVAKRFPEATVTFRSMCLLLVKEKQIIEDIPEPARSRLKQQLYAEEETRDDSCSENDEGRDEEGQVVEYSRTL